MPTARTVSGVPFEYRGSLEAGLVVLFKSSAMKISPDIVRIIRQEIAKRSLGDHPKPAIRDHLKTGQ